jgi:hypothetical protein
MKTVNTQKSNSKVQDTKSHYVQDARSGKRKANLATTPWWCGVEVAKASREVLLEKVAIAYTFKRREKRAAEMTMAELIGLVHEVVLIGCRTIPLAKCPHCSGETPETMGDCIYCGEIQEHATFTATPKGIADHVIERSFARVSATR